MLRNRKAVVGLGILLFFALVAVFAPWLAPGNPSGNVGPLAAPPSPEHLFGTTPKGQDVFALTVHGARSSLGIGFLVGIIATVVGVTIGMIGAYYGRFIDEVLSLLTNVFLLIPGLPLLIILAAFLPPGPATVTFVLAVTGWAGCARVVRAQAMTLRSKDFVSAAMLAGDSALRITFREILPNMTSVVMASFLGCVLFGIGAQAGLEFLGLGDISVVSWGVNLFWAQNDGSFLRGIWWTFLPAGLCIALVAFALAMLNYATDELTNPRLRVFRRPKK